MIWRVLQIVALITYIAACLTDGSTRSVVASGTAVIIATINAGVETILKNIDKRRKA